MALMLRSSKIHDAGCYTTTPLKMGDRIVEYTGPRITVEEADERYYNCERTYLFGLTDEKYVIDGNSVASFINHSCDPNCEADEFDGRVWILALRDIQAGEELTYDYNLYDGEDDDPSLCLCGVKTCRGSLYSAAELERRAQAAGEPQPSTS